jgi:antitoxin component YwqK of YwqJK toxin-antitoxin module
LSEYICIRFSRLTILGTGRIRPNSYLSLTLGVSRLLGNVCPQYFLTTEEIALKNLALAILIVLLAPLTLTYAAENRRCAFLGGPDLLFVANSPEAKKLRTGTFREGDVERDVFNGELTRERVYDGTKIVSAKTFRDGMVNREETYDPDGNYTRKEFYNNGTVREVDHFVNARLSLRQRFDQNGDGTLTLFDENQNSFWVSKLKHFGRVALSERLSTARTRWKTPDGTIWTVTGWSVAGTKRATFKNERTGSEGFVEIYWWSPDGKFREVTPRYSIEGQYSAGKKEGRWTSTQTFEGGKSFTTTAYSQGVIRNIFTQSNVNGELFERTISYNEEGLPDREDSGPIHIVNFSDPGQPHFTHPKSTTTWYHSDKHTTVTHFHDGSLARRQILEFPSARILSEEIYEGIDDPAFPKIIKYDDFSRPVEIQAQYFLQTFYYESGVKEDTIQRQNSHWAETFISSEHGKTVIRYVKWNTRSGIVDTEIKYTEDGAIYESYYRKPDHSVLTHVGPPYIVLWDYASDAVSYQISNDPDSHPHKSDTIRRNGRTNRQIIEELTRNW